MGRGSPICAFACAAAIFVLLPAGSATAAVPFYCDAETYPEANVRMDAPGMWSDGSAWSLGHAPMAGEDVCVDGAGVTMDVDVEVRDLWAWELHVPAGRTLAVTHGITGTLQVDGMLRTVGSVDDEYLDLRGSPAGTMALDATHPLHVEQLQGIHDLHLVGDSELETYALDASGSITGGDGAVLVVQDGVAVGTDGTDATLDVDLRDARSLYLRGRVHVDAAAIRSELVTIAASEPGSVLDDVSVAGHDLFFDGSPTGTPLVAGGTFDVDFLSVAEGQHVTLTGCAPTSAGTTFFIEPGGLLTTRDTDCIDPPTGVQRTLAGPDVDPFRLGAPGVVLDFDGTLDAGGTLELHGWVGVPGGRRVVDGATVVTAGGQLGVRATGTGTATVVDLAAEPAALGAGAGSTLRLEAPRFDQVVSSSEEGGGAVEVVDDAPRERSIVGLVDRAATGSVPVRYLTAAGEYEPRRSFVELEGGDWSPSVAVNVGSLYGWGTVRGSGTVQAARACGGTLSLVGDLAITEQGTCGGPGDVLDVARPTPPTTNPSSDGTTTTVPPVTTTPPIVAPPRVTRVIRSGNARANRLVGGRLADRLFGRGGNDVLTGGAGNDHLDGGAGNDRISCGRGPRDRAFGGTGNDTITCRDGRRGAVVDCGPGRDRAIVDRGDRVRRCEVVIRR